MKTIKIIGAALIGALVAGCVVVPTELPVMDRDSAVYEDQGAQEVKKETKMKVAVVVVNDDNQQAAEISKVLEASLTAAIGDFEFFQLVQLPGEAKLIASNLAKGAEDPEGKVLEHASFLIDANLNGFAGALTQVPYSANAMFSGKGNVAFRFRSLASNKIIMTKNIGRDYSCLDASSFANEASKIADHCAKVFAQELGNRYAPPVRVVETRGNCQVAQAMFGSNYGAVKGSKVEFFEYVDNSAIVKGQTRAPRVVATGKILSSDLKTCWIEVDNFEKVHVKKGHYVRLASDQSKGMLDTMKEGLPTL